MIRFRWMLLFIILPFFACELPQPIPVVEGVCFKTIKPQDRPPEEAWGRVTIKWIDVLGIQLPPGPFPIYVPIRGEWDVYGRVWSTYNNTREGTDTIIELDIGKLSNQPPQKYGNLLPNGDPIPMGNESETLSKLPLNNPNEPPKDYIYFDVSEGSIFLGLSFQQRSFDKLGKNIKMPLSLFLPLYEDEQRTVQFGAAGVYFSPEPGKNGVAAFIEASVLINDLQAEICRGRINN